MDAPFTFPQLPALPTLPASFSSGLSLPFDLTGAFTSGVASGVSDAAKKSAWNSHILGLGGLSVGQIVSILVGLLFILAAVLSFKDSRELVLNAGKTAAKAAAVAA